MKAYCPNCGSATEYSLSKPKFCSGCGNSYTSVANAAPIKKVFRPMSQVTEEEAEEEEYFSTNINKLDFEIQGEGRLRPQRLQDIAGSSPNNIDDGYQREVDSSYSKETIMQDFLKDAGSSRSNNGQT
tara:strand:- start:1516 stop:1899 length:384 start_codon:yes stop_codon:yes gene_type:complete